MKQIGRVTETKDGFATVVVSRKSACESCHANVEGSCSGCITFSKRELSVRARNTMGAKVGDRVVLTTDSKKVFFSAFMIFAFPCLMLLAGIATHNNLENTMIQYYAGVILFLVSAIAAPFILNLRYAKRCDVEITDILNSGESCHVTYGKRPEDD